MSTTLSQHRLLGFEIAQLEFHPLFIAMLAKVHLTSHSRILGISELKWTGMGEFNSDDHYIYYCGQESLRRNGVAIMVNKRTNHITYKSGFC